MTLIRRCIGLFHTRSITNVSSLCRPDYGKFVTNFETKQSQEDVQSYMGTILKMYPHLKQMEQEVKESIVNSSQKKASKKQKLVEEVMSPAKQNVQVIMKEFDHANSLEEILKSENLRPINSSLKKEHFCTTRRCLKWFLFCV